jgi:pantetheine-phosphate adenylyltransferase
MKHEESRVAVVPGSFDPITNGHVDVIERAVAVFDRVIVGVAVNPDKKPLFSVEERVSFIREVFEGNQKVLVEPYDTLLVDFARKHGARVIVRGLRAVSDFEREFQIAQFNKKLDRDIETFFVMSSPEFMYLSSSAVKEVARYGGCVRGLVPHHVEKVLRERFTI